MEPQYIWKIRQISTGKFSGGGNRIYGTWNKRGRTWNTEGHLRQHISSNMKYYAEQENDIEVVKFSISIEERKSVSKVIEDVLENRKKANQKRASATKKREIARLKSELDKLEKE